MTAAYDEFLQVRDKLRVVHQLQADLARAEETLQKRLELLRTAAHAQIHVSHPDVDAAVKRAQELIDNEH